MSRRWVFRWVMVVAVVVLCECWSVTLGQESGERAAVKSAADQKFAPFPNVPACMTGAVERGNPETGPSVILIKGSAGCVVPWHWHTPNEQVMIVSGTGRIEMKGEKPALVRAGGYVFAPSHHVHRFSCLGACSAFVHSDGTFDVHYVDQAGNEIPPEQALKHNGAMTTQAKK